MFFPIIIFFFIVITLPFINIILSLFFSPYYVTNEVKVNVGIEQVKMKDAHVILQKTIILTKKSGKGKHECEKVCHEINMLHKTQNPCENMFWFEYNFIPKNLRIH